MANLYSVPCSGGKRLFFTTTIFFCSLFSTAAAFHSGRVNKQQSQFSNNYKQQSQFSNNKQQLFHYNNKQLHQYTTRMSPASAMLRGGALEMYPIRSFDEDNDTDDDSTTTALLSSIAQSIPERFPTDTDIPTYTTGSARQRCYSTGSINSINSSRVIPRGGGDSMRVHKETAIIQQQQQQALSPAQYRQIAITAGVVGVLSFLFFSRHMWLPLLDRHKIQHGTLTVLNKLKRDSGASDVQPMIIYGLGLAFWEALGLSTIPVETAAAMVFGWAAVFPSAIGKLVGALSAFTLSRTLLKNFMQQRLTNNYSLLRLLNTSTRPAWQTAFLFKFSCLPALLKNCGPSLVPNIAYWMFTLPTILHGWSFTGLWTWVGVDAAIRLQAETIVPSNSGLQIALFIAGVFGIGGMPLLTAWWMRDLAKQQKLAQGETLVE